MVWQAEFAVKTKGFLQLGGGDVTGLRLPMHVTISRQQLFPSFSRIGLITQVRVCSNISMMTWWS